MEFKRVKLLSGMLSAAAIASMTGMPVLAGETAEECFSLANTLENGQAEETADQGTVNQFLGTSQSSEDFGENKEDANVSAISAESAAEDDGQDVIIPMAADTAEADSYAGAAQDYNEAVLPELTVSLAKDNVVNSVLEEHVTEEAPAFEKK